MALINCEKCGKKISDKANGCPHCGWLIDGESRKQDNIDARADVLKNKFFKNHKSKRNFFVGIGLVCIVICSGSIVAFTSNDRKYKQAVVAYNNAEYHKAQSLFEELEDFEDSSDWLLKTNHQIDVENDDVAPVIYISEKNISCWVGDELSVDDILLSLSIYVEDDVTDIIEYEVLKEDIDTSKEGEQYIVLSAKDEAGNITEEKITVDISIKPSDAYYAYLDAVNIEIDSLNQDSSGTYWYEGISLVEDETDWIFDWGEKQGATQLNQNALYNSIAKIIEDFYIGGEAAYDEWKENANLIFDFDEIPQTWDEMLTFVKKVSPFITDIHPLESIMKKFDSLDSVNGDFDFINRKFKFEIKDLNATAKEMGINPTMLGYILACLDVYAPTADIQPNSYSCYYEPLVEYEAAELKETDFYIREVQSDEKTERYLYKYNCDVLSMMKEVYGDGSWTYYIYVPELGDTTKKGIITTARNVEIGTTKKEVLALYGATKEYNFSGDSDLLYTAFLNSGIENGSVLARRLKEQSKSYVFYTYDNKAQIVFYFDHNDEVHTILYLDGVYY